MVVTIDGVPILVSPHNDGLPMVKIITEAMDDSRIEFMLLAIDAAELATELRSAAGMAIERHYGRYGT